MRTLGRLSLITGLLLAGACGDDGTDKPDTLFPDKPECEGAAIQPFAGSNPMVISKLAIGSAQDGFDLDNDGDPDNKLAAVGSLAQSSIDDSFKEYTILIPFEFFDLAGAAADTCVKFGIYLGDYITDKDSDGDGAYVPDGDCNDNVAAIKRGATEITDNLFDDDCDGLADEDGQDNPSANDVDGDGDGISPMDGDCDDTVMSIHPGATEVCHDGLDQDCDGVADRSEDAQGNATACSPFDPGKNDIPLDPLSLKDGAPAISFSSGEIKSEGGGLKLYAGPSIFSVNIPITDELSLDLRITGAQIVADVVEQGGAIVLKNGHLGGVIDSVTADTIRGLEVEDIGLTMENSLLDAVFANLLGPLLALPKANDAVTGKYPGCRTPDIDVDQDGLEAFCDSCAETPDAEGCQKNTMGEPAKAVDVCIDGDGTEVRDVVGANGIATMQCTEAVEGGKRRFVDGISVELNFETVNIKSIKPPR
ncbi:MAG: putative metal-binding motif-containing protein [Kofleriaceae bacterium]|nr:putative metal-binding motif-containing protein [Kofleriaceae bacterium]